MKLHDETTRGRKTECSCVQERMQVYTVHRRPTSSSYSYPRAQDKAELDVEREHGQHRPIVLVNVRPYTIVALGGGTVQYQAFTCTLLR